MPFVPISLSSSGIPKLWWRLCGADGGPGDAEPAASAAGVVCVEDGVSYLRSSLPSAGRAAARSGAAARACGAAAGRAAARSGATARAAGAGRLTAACSGRAAARSGAAARAAGAGRLTAACSGRAAARSGAAARAAGAGRLTAACSGRAAVRSGAAARVAGAGRLTAVASGLAAPGLTRAAVRLCGSAPRLFTEEGAETGRAADWPCCLAVVASAELGLAPMPPGPPLKLVRLLPRLGTVWLYVV